MNEEELRARIVELETENNALKEAIFERDWEAISYDEEWNISELCEKEAVIKDKNILADGYHSRVLIPLVNKYGFDKVNERVMQELTQRQIEREMDKAKEACEDACTQK